MVYRQTYIESHTKNEVRSVLSLSDYILQTTRVRQTPYRKVSTYLSGKLRIKLFVVKLIQSYVGETVYVNDDKQVLYQLTPHTRSLLAWLSTQGLLATWNFGRPLPTMTLSKSIYLMPEPIKVPGGGTYYATGANGIGCAESFDQAALSAIGEFIERNASAAYWWENNDLFIARHDNSTTRIDPTRFMGLADNQYNTTRMIVPYETQNKLGWTSAIDFCTSKKCDVPASLVYMYYRYEFKNEPFFHEVSSNGAATYSNYQEATSRAILELIERHVFIRFWYHKQSVTKINTESLASAFPVLQEFINYLPDSESIAVYEVTNSLGVPTYIATHINHNNSKTAFNITAASDICAHDAIAKAIKEIVRFAEEQYSVTKDLSATVDFTSASELKTLANSLNNRRKLWSYQEMLPYVDWLNNSKEINYDHVVSNHNSQLSAIDRYQWLQNICLQNKVQIYIADVTNSVARYAGLHVVRALSPDLLSIFFKEEYQPLANKLFTHNDSGKKVVINPIPHPFI